MSQIAYANPRAARPALGPITTPTSDATAARGRRAAWVPLAISIGAHWLFFIQYWIPETGAFPARDWWLTQLSPLVSPALTSRGDALVPAQENQLGIAAFIWLHCGIRAVLAVPHPRLVGADRDGAAGGGRHAGRPRHLHQLAGESSAVRTAESPRS